MSEATTPIRTRIAPSPTGSPHIGTIYQAMFDYVFAKKYNGQFIVRIEDTDRTRFVEGAEEEIFSVLDWFGLRADEDPIKGGQYGPYRQSERLDTYKKYAQQLVEKGNAYYCFCTKERLEEMRQEQQKQKKSPKYDRYCLSLPKEKIQELLVANTQYVIRMKVPDNQTITVRDAVVGEVTFDTNQIDDQVLIKADGFPTYHLAVVVDDYLMQVTHIFRGSEWLPSTPKHVLLYTFFEWEESIPVFIHLPVILNADGKGKLSKRHGHASVDFYKKEGYLPEAILNYLSNIVWNHPQGEEVYPLEDFEAAFDKDAKKIIDISPQGPRFDLQKLTWMNGIYIRNLSDEDLKEKLLEYDAKLASVLDKEENTILLQIAKSRMRTLKDFKELISEPSEQYMYSSEEKDLLISLEKELKNILVWEKEEILSSLKAFAASHNVSMKTMYVLLTGKPQGLPLPEMLQWKGKQGTLERIAQSST